MMTRSQTRIAELEARIAELEKENKELKEETKEYQAVEQFIIETDIDSALRAHYREGKVIDGEWVNNENSDKDEDEEDEEEYWMVCCSSRVFDEEGMLDGLLAENEEHFICFAKAKDAYDNFVKYEENNLNDMTCNPMREPICAEIALWSSKDYHTGKEELERWYYDFEEEETSQGHNFKEQEFYKKEGLNITSEAAKLANQWQLDADDIAEEVKPTGADNTIRRNDLKEIVKAAIKAWDEEVFSDEDDDEN